MKKIIKYLLRIVALALAIMLVVVCAPYVKSWVSDHLLDGRYTRTALLLTQEMQKAGELTAVRHQETGRMDAKIEALAIGVVGSVQADYSYEIGLGITLNEVSLIAQDDGITVQVPAVRMLYDRFLVTGEPRISDVWNLMTETRYQAMLDEQAAECKERYLSDAETLENAWTAACEQLEALFYTWAGESIRMTFEKPELLL